MVGVRRVDEAARLLTVDAFGKVAVEECVLHVELMDRPAPASGEMEHHADRAGLDNRRESVGEVDARSLMKSSNDPPSLIPVQSAIGLQFVAKNPLATDDVGGGWLWNESPRSVALQGVELLLHRGEPVRIADGDAHRRR